MEANKTLLKEIANIAEIEGLCPDGILNNNAIKLIDEYANQLLLEKDKEVERLMAELSEIKEKHKEELQKSFTAGCRFQEGEQKSWETYNELTGSQKPNKEMNFEQYYTQTYGQ